MCTSYGLSSRGRGSHPRGQPPRLRHGSIPAWAGEPTSGRGQSDPGRVYPRVVGGARPEVPAAAVASGLSPRGRGSRADRPAHHPRDRSIPAWAGSRREGRRGQKRMGSIPAWAGEPCSSARTPRWLGVYPRVGGGAERVGRWLHGGSGLSPRGRGSLRPPGLHLHDPGSIPAWAGEPGARRTSRSGMRVYPRVGGGAATASIEASSSAGLSPRGRGSPRTGAGGGQVPGSIPAWAGEPTAGAIVTGAGVVYPRVGGGAVLPTRHAAPAPPDGGLSPRGRGSPDLPQQRRHRPGSIPAWAGEPTIPFRKRTIYRVYPRVGGGAIQRRTSDAVGRGLSPRGRGSLRGQDPPRKRYGSIPAWAGEPRRGA